MKTRFTSDSGSPSLVLLTLAAVALPLTARANHADFFIDGAFSSSSSLGDVGEASGSSDNILGAFRKYETVNNNFSGTVSTSLAAGGPLRISDSAGAMGTYWYGYGSFSDSGSDLNANFIGAANWNALVFTVDSVSGSGALSLTLESGPTTFTFSDITVNSAGDYVFFHDEALTAAPTFDFTDIDGVSFEMDSLTANSAFDLSNFTREFVIPEPATSALILMSGLVLFRRRRS